MHVMILVIAVVLIGIEFLKYGMRQTVEVLNEQKLCYLETRIKSGKSAHSVYDVMSCEAAEAKFNSMVGKTWLVDRFPVSYESKGAASEFELLIPFENRFVTRFIDLIRGDLEKATGRKFLDIERLEWEKQDIKVMFGLENVKTIMTMASFALGVLLALNFLGIAVERFKKRRALF